MKRSFRVACAVVFVVALIIRLVYLHQIRPIPLFDYMIGDAESYDAWGQRIAGGEWVGREVFYQAPLYPYFLGVIYKVGGHSVLIARVVQAVIGAAACVLLALAGRAFFSHKVGVAAGLLLAIYPTAIFFDGLIQKSVLDSFLVCLLLFFAGATLHQAGRQWWWIGIGATLGALMLTRENAAVLVVVMIAWIALHPAAKGRRLRARAFGFVLVALIAVVFPVAMRNAVVSGEFHITTSQLGPNFYIGNNPQASGAYVPLVYGHGSAKNEREDATLLAEKAVGRKLSPGEVSRYWLDQATQFIRAEPAAWGELMRIKTMLFWNATEIGDTEDQYVYADWSSILRVLNPVFHFGLLCALAAIGFVITIRHWRTTWLLAAIVLVYAASVIAFYVMARYRYPIVPVLMLFAAAGIVGSIDALRGRRRVESWMIILAVVWAGWVWLATRPVRNDMVRASTYQNIAHALDDQNRLDEAFVYYERARDLWPNDALVNIMLGRIRLDQKRPAEAIPHFSEAVRVAPSYAPAHVALGAGLLESGRIDEAELEFRKALVLDPENARAQEGMHQIRARQSLP